MYVRNLACVAWLFYAQSRAATGYYPPTGLPEHGLIVDRSCEDYEHSLAVTYNETAQLIRAGLYYLSWPNESPFKDYFREPDVEIVKTALRAARDILEHHGAGTPLKCFDLDFCRHGGKRRGLAQVGDWNGRDEYDTINLCPQIFTYIPRYDPCNPSGHWNRVTVRAPTTLLHEIIQARQLLRTGQSIGKDYVYGSVKCKLLKQDSEELPEDALRPQPRNNVDSYAQYAKAALTAMWENDTGVQSLCKQKGVNLVLRRPRNGLARSAESILLGPYRVMKWRDQVPRNPKLSGAYEDVLSWLDDLMVQDIKDGYKSQDAEGENN